MSAVFLDKDSQSFVDSCGGVDFPVKVPGVAKGALLHRWSLDASLALAPLGDPVHPLDIEASAIREAVPVPSWRRM